MEMNVRIGKTTCIGCINSIESRLRWMGVKRFDYDFQTKVARILYDDEKLVVSDVVRAIEDLGYEAKAF